jgi:23S rRNA (cytidine2498-2'-O)-methyltransferase
VHLFLAADYSSEALQAELGESFPQGTKELRPGLFACDFELSGFEQFPRFVFARQIVPDAQEVGAPSIRGWAAAVVDAVVGVLPDEKPWSLHVYPQRGLIGPRLGARAFHTRARQGQPHAAKAEHPAATASDNRARFVREAIVEELKRRRRHLLRSLREDGGIFGEDEALVQLLLLGPETGFLSIAQAPLPYRDRHALSCFPGGEVPIASDKQAPSRAFAKLVEAEARMSRRIGAYDSCVDLGASPGSWTYVAARRGAKVIAVDRSELRADLMQQRNVRFERGDAFRFVPNVPVDWLLCDVIARAERTAELLSQWLRERWCQHFVVTLKLDDLGSSALLSRLKRELPELTSELWLSRLSANKHEVCAFGTIAAP